MKSRPTFDSSFTPVSLILLLLRCSSVSLDKMLELASILQPIGPNSLLSSSISSYSDSAASGQACLASTAPALSRDLSCIFIALAPWCRPSSCRSVRPHCWVSWGRLLRGKWDTEDHLSGGHLGCYEVVELSAGVAYLGYLISTHELFKNIIIHQVLSMQTPQ